MRDIFDQIQQSITTSVQAQEIPPVIDNKVVFPLVCKTALGQNGEKILSDQFHLGVCLKALIGREVEGLQFVSNSDESQDSIGWVVSLKEPQSLIIAPDLN